MSRTLRIFLCCQQSLRRHAVPACAFWAGHFRQGIAEAGHVCLEEAACDWAEGLLPLEATEAARWRDRTWSQALNTIKREHARHPIDLFLGYLFPRQVEASAVSELRRLGIPSVNFFCDNVREFRRIPPEFRPFDFHWVPEYKALPMYQAAGLKYLHAPMPCWVPPEVRGPVERENGEVVFVGTRDVLRGQLFAEAIGLGLPVVLQGVGWDAPAQSAAAGPPRASAPEELLSRQIAFARQHGWTALWRKHTAGRRSARSADFDFTSSARPSVPDEDYWSTLRNCTVCLGVNRYPSFRFSSQSPDTYSRLRDIEAPMAGACYLTEWTAGLDQIYELGAEIETYQTPAELVEKTRELSGNSSRRQRMRAAAQRRALEEHSVPRTLWRIAETMNCPP